MRLNYEAGGLVSNRLTSCLWYTTPLAKPEGIVSQPQSFVWQTPTLGFSPQANACTPQPVWSERASRENEGANTRTTHALGDRQRTPYYVVCIQREVWGTLYM